MGRTQLIIPTVQPAQSTDPVERAKNELELVRGHHRPDICYEQGCFACRAYWAAMDLAAVIEASQTEQNNVVPSMGSLRARYIGLLVKDLEREYSPSACDHIEELLARWWPAAPPDDSVGRAEGSGLPAQSAGSVADERADLTEQGGAE